MQTKSRKLLLYPVLFVVLIILGAWAWSVAKSKPMSKTELDQLVMQATYGQDLKSMRTLQKHAESQHVDSQLAVAKVYLFKHQSKQATAWLDRAAQQGSAEAAVLLGKLYFQGNSDVEINFPVALKWFQQAEHSKNPSAAYYLGLMYKNGYGIQADPKKAVQYFKVAVEGEIPTAMFMLGNAYQYGDGVKTDLKQAVYWYKQAAEREVPEAIQALAYIYRDGNAVMAQNHDAYQHQILEIGHALKHPAIQP